MKKTCLLGLLTGVLLVGSVGSAFAAEKVEMMELKNAKFITDEVIIKASEIKEGEPCLIEVGTGDTKFNKIDFDKANKDKKILSVEEMQKLIDEGIKNGTITVKKGYNSIIIEK
ncbi:MAG: hypothetical protein ACRC76_11560 [Proteocatella sp.]